jgi:putative component of membrane protein insertase Oxa1/YidC/SpoIIIJ protein YidD
MKIISNSITFCSLYLVKKINKFAKHKLTYHFTEGFLAIPKVEHGNPWFQKGYNMITYKQTNIYLKRYTN